MNSNKSESGTGTIFFKIKIKLIETLFTAKSRIVRKPIHDISTTISIFTVTTSTTSTTSTIFTVNGKVFHNKTLVSCYKNLILFL